MKSVHLSAFISLSLIFSPFSLVAAEAKTTKFCKTLTTGSLKRSSCKRISKKFAEKEVGKLCPAGSRRKYQTTMIGKLKDVPGPKLLVGNSVKDITSGKAKTKRFTMCGATWKVCVTCSK